MKKIAAVIIVLCLSASLLPTVSLAAVTPHFVAVNDTLMPYNDSTMPLFTGGEFFLPLDVFWEAGVFFFDNAQADRARLYRGSRHVDFYTSNGTTVNQDGQNLSWPSARRIGSRFYVPLRHVCAYFGLEFEIINIRRDIIPEESLFIIRVKSENMWVLNAETFMGIRRNEIRAAYNQYHAPPPWTGPGQRPGVAVTLPEADDEEPPLTYSDVTMHLSFHDLSAGGAAGILGALDTPAVSGYQGCFFVSAEDIAGDPGLVRKISGSSHALGIWLNEGTFEEYIEISALLFEAAKVRTVIVAADAASEAAIETSEQHGLIFWNVSRSFGTLSEHTESSVTDTFPTDGGERQNFLFASTEELAELLPGILAFLREHEYTVDRITETTEPV